MREWQKVCYVAINQVHLFGDVMSAQLLVKLQKGSGLKCLIAFVKALFADLQEIRSVRWKNEVQLATLPDALQRPENEDTVADNWRSCTDAWVSAQQKWFIFSGDIRGVEHTVAVEGREESVPLAGPAFADHVHHTA